MISNTEANNDFTELILWIAANMVQVLLVSFIILFPKVSAGNVFWDSFFDIEVIIWIMQALAFITLLGGGLVIAFFQWLFIRRHPNQTSGKNWLMLGLLSSFPAAFAAVLVLGLGGGLTENDFHFSVILVISLHFISLGITQGLSGLPSHWISGRPSHWLRGLSSHSWGIKRAAVWASLHFLGFVSLLLVSYNMIFRSSFSSALVYVLETFMLLGIFAFSGLWILRNLITEMPLKNR